MQLDDYLVIDNQSGQVVFAAASREQAFEWAERQVQRTRYEQLGVYAREGVAEGQVSVRWLA